MVAENHEQEAPRNSNVTLRCKAQNTNIQPDIRWYRESLPLPRSARMNGEYLHIYQVQDDDGGRYFCEMANGAGASTDYVVLRIVGM